MYPLMRAATAVGIDGIFAEVHPFPDRGLSDGPNMLRLSDFEEILKRAELYGGWLPYVATEGEPDTGDELLDDLLKQLDAVAEKVYLQANKLRIRHGIKD